MAKKKKYSDQPRYKTIYGYEDNFKNAFSSYLKSMTKDIAKEVVSLAGVKKNR